MTFITCEAGINANGDIEIAKQLIDAAVWCGANAIKWQKRDIEVVYAGQLDSPRESPWGTTLRAQKEGLEFGQDEWEQIVAHCRFRGIQCYASAWDLNSLDFISQFDFPYNKIASAMASNKEFVCEVGRECKPTFMSTAMSLEGDIGQSIDWCADRRDYNDLTLMHCVGTYPAAESDLNLMAIQSLRDTFDLRVGYSGHEASVSPSVIAVALGAVAVERHITLDRSMYGSDQAASLEPHGFKSMVDQIRKIPAILGDGVKRITDGEQEVARKLRYWLR